MKTVAQKHVEEKIMTIRDVQVMLDKDLAAFYEVAPIRLREQVRRNTNRFPADFVFQLTELEVEQLVSQNAIPSKKSLGGSLPYVFTEQGVAAVSGVLKSDKAAEVSILIIRAFVALRKTVLQIQGILQRLERLEWKNINTDKSLERLLNALERNEIPRQGIFFEGQLFDAHVFVSNIIKKAKMSIVLVDNYVDENTLLLLSKRNANISCTIITRMNKVLQLDLNKNNLQNAEIKVIENNASHVQ